MEWLLVIAVVVLLSKLNATRKQMAATEQTMLRALDAQAHAPRSLEGIVMAVTGGFAYWFDDDADLVRAPWNGQFADLDDVEIVDPLSLDDLNPADVVTIITAIEDATAKHAAGGKLDALGG